MNPLKKALYRVLPRKYQIVIDRYRQKKFSLRFTLGSGVNISVSTDVDWHIYNDIFVEDEYDVPIMECLRRQNPAEPLKVIDLGANVGYFSLRFIDLMRKNGYEKIPFSITMVEGSPFLHKELQARLAAAGDFGKQTVAINGLVGKREGTENIREGVFHPMNSIMRSGPGDVEVKYVDLSKVIGETSQPIALLKCDIEGAELAFIEHYPELLKNVRAAVFELHPKLCDYDRCMQLLKEAGLDQYKVLRATDNDVVASFWRASADAPAEL